MTAEVMWRRIRPTLATVGVTRIADITWLDQVGIPCWQAIRPNARTLSVAQGKGTTPQLAAISAAMEAIEIWHAENLAGCDLVAQVGEVEESLGYPLRALRLRSRSFLHRGTTLEWTVAQRLVDGAKTLLPTDSLRLDSTVEPVWDAAHFDVSSNGLAGGATGDEAILHALCEVVERDAMTRDQAERARVPLDEIPAVAAELAERFLRTGLSVIVEQLPTPVRVPAFRVQVFGDDFPVVFCGSAAKLDPVAALCAALAEAAQSRVAAIAGTREDLGADLYHGGDWFKAAAEAPVRTATWPEVAEADLFNPGTEVAVLAERILALTGFSPLLVDHTQAKLDIPVVRVVCPGLLCPPDY